MRSLAAILFLMLGALPLRAASPAEVAQLWQALEMPRVVVAMRAEGIGYGQQLDAEMLAGTGGARFAAAIAGLYDAETMEARGRAALEAELRAAEIGPILGFLASDLGQRAVAAELAAREALLDPEVERAARLQAQRLQRRAPARWRHLTTLAEAGGLVEDNVAGALSANLAFLSGLADGGAPGIVHDPDLILDEVWAQEEAVRADTEAWVMAFLTLATSPLGDADVEDYAAFSDSPPGRLLNRALIAAFDPVFIEISHGLGLAVARELAGSDL